MSCTDGGGGHHAREETRHRGRSDRALIISLAQVLVELSQQGRTAMLANLDEAIKQLDDGGDVRGQRDDPTHTMAGTCGVKEMIPPTHLTHTHTSS